MKPKSQYLKLRAEYTPIAAKLILLFESPPASGLYFYDPAGSVNEPVFREMMKLIGEAPKSKHEGLLSFQRSGLVLMDATYVAVNTMSNRDRNQVIMEGFPSLKEDLLSIDKKATTPLLLVKVNVCDLLHKPLEQAGFNVLNNGLRIPFPSNGNQKRFHDLINTIDQIKLIVSGQ